ncbi:hypothetical protein SBOR_1152 [Sclerotinia borealis F-4128]|uniref:Uncharacterized protein n=1 Tax=Sclerotinia borealis (strain F-4128) TaxID=1432307 RepID=W9CVC8_SCLBF|nr:hypothetical protein SBOR_1152 [Sclerotinia borealis F-4128]
MSSTLLKTIVLLALASLSVADLHTTAICINDSSSGDGVYNSKATIASCTNYFNRNTGSEQWDTCPDCVMITTGIPHCSSPAEHMGGDEITYYCKQNGADNALTS